VSLVDDRRRCGAPLPEPDRAALPPPMPSLSPRPLVTLWSRLRGFRLVDNRYKRSASSGIWARVTTIVSPKRTSVGTSVSGSA
jgi:hypothetical protein